MIKCMVWAESEGDPNENQKKGRRFPHGLMQIKPCYWQEECTKRLGHKFDPHDPCDNLTCGISILCGTGPGEGEGDPGKYGTQTPKYSMYWCCMNYGGME